MRFLVEMYRSTLAKKVVMAVTGMVLFGFVLGHMIGNFKFYQAPIEVPADQAAKYPSAIRSVAGDGREVWMVPKIDVYAVGLREIGAPVLGNGEALWLARIGLLLAVLLHIWSAWELTPINRRARPQGYAVQKFQAATYASRTMRWGGVILLLFVIYHLMHLTFGNVHPEFQHGQVFRNLVIGFKNPLVAGFYIAAQLALGLHLFHGLWSMFQSLGLSGSRFDQVRKNFAIVFAIALTLGNISFPVAVWTGMVH